MHKKTEDINNPQISEGDSISGYSVKRITELKEIEAFCYELEHGGTGAKHIHISNNDSDNTFSVAFKTVPADSTGVAHILEHTVLCGSHKYPVRDPFFSMIKRSLNTFMNAFTSSDWTMYPFATQNRKDYENLMDIYLDAVFFPKLEELSFKQEGHRLELKKKTDAGQEQLVYKGIVYNEMKGAMSSPAQVMARSLLRALYPSTTYGFNSGGEPAEIPTLSHKDLIEFHKKHYHPSNAFFYTYGNFPLKENLTFIHENYLKGFSRTTPETDVSPQPRWNEPRQSKDFYPLGRNEKNAAKSQVCVAWLTADIKDSFHVIALTLLGHILLGNSASPLRKALIDSKLGTALCDATGYDPDNLDTMFAVGLKDVKSSDAPKIEAIIFDILKNLAEKGIPTDLAEAAIHQIEFHKKEVTNSPYPYGIKLLLGITGPWLHGGDPGKVLKIDEDLTRIREELSRGGFFENLIKRYFLENNHRVLFTLEPDREKEPRETARVEAELEKIQSGLTAAMKKQIEADAEALKKLQETKENLSCLPTLEIEDIPEDIKVVKENREYANLKARCYRQPTSGIFYLTSIRDVGDLPQHLMPLLPFFASAITRMGTSRRSYEEIAKLISAHTGGLGMSVHARTGFDSSVDCLSFISFHGKCLNRKQEKMFDLSRELLLEYDFSNLERLRSLLLEYRAALESSVIQNGHGLSASLAARNFSKTAALNESWHGVHQLAHIKEMTEGLADPEKGRNTLEAVSKNLETIAAALLAGKPSEIAIVGEEEMILSAATAADTTFKGLPPGEPLHFTDPAIETGEKLVREGWSTDSSVSFVSACFETVKMGHRDAPGLSIISKLLRSLYLHREIREKGGAYGGFSTYSSETGLFGLGSYRDPHILNTLKVYDNAASFIRSGDFTDEDVKEAILQVCSDIDKPDTPAMAARKSFFRNILGLSDEARLLYKKQLLEITKKRVLEVAETYFTPERMNLSVAVISGEDKLKETNLKLKEAPFTLHKI